jgi:hypothetical protein
LLSLGKPLSLTLGNTSIGLGQSCPCLLQANACTLFGVIIDAGYGVVYDPQSQLLCHETSMSLRCDTDNG